MLTVDAFHHAVNGKSFPTGVIVTTSLCIYTATQIIRLNKGTRYEQVWKLGKGDHLVQLKTTPQFRKKWPGLSTEVAARLLAYSRKGKTYQLLTSMTDGMRYPGGGNG
ncbi:hypothetical protein PPNK14_41030 [Pectobacterium parmentieri]